MKFRIRAAMAAVALSGVFALSAAPALAQKGLSSAEKVTARFTVESVDAAARKVVLKDEKGASLPLSVPAEVRNLDQLKPGDTVTATYVRETELVLSPRGKPLPKDAATLATARAAKGDMPGAVAANHIVVSGSVVATDVAKNTVSLVSPQGGSVHTIDVRTAEGRAALKTLKVGDSITAIVTEGLLVAADRN